jgi:hypothetical protein
MDDLWKIWRHAGPRDALKFLIGIMLASLFIHYMVMTTTGRYAEGLLGTAGM